MARRPSDEDLAPTFGGEQTPGSFGVRLLLPLPT